MMSSVKVECVVAAGALIGEGPVWEEPEQQLLFVDIAGQKIHRWSPNTNQTETMKTDDSVSFVVPRRGGGYVAGVGRSIVAADWSSQTMTSLVTVDDDKPNNRLNDGKVDPKGRLLAGTMGREVRPTEVEPEQGSLFSVNADLSVTSHLEQVNISNGLDWSLDGETFFYIDSLSLRVDAFDYDLLTGRLGNRRTVYRVPQGAGFPDGMTTDAEGKLWIAVYNGGRVLRVDPITGVLLQTVSLPVSKTTSCCFGGRDLSDLYVTSASLGLDQSELSKQPQAGGTFRVSGLGVKGRPSNSFSG